MDYEFRIKRLECETAHLRAMQKLIEGHEDITDKSLKHCDEAIAGLLRITAETTANVAANTLAIAALGRKVDQLVDAMLHTGGNGKPTA
jgi:hypothetical protein